MKKEMENNGSLKAKKQIVIVAMTGRTLLYFAGPTDVFFHANRYLKEYGITGGYDVLVVSPTSHKTIKTETGISIQCEHSAPEITTPIDTLIIAGNDLQEFAQSDFTELYDWLATRNEGNTRRIASICGGTFALAKAGKLDGRKVTTHWALAERLRKAYPDIEVNDNPFFTRDGYLYTSAGVTTGIDLALALVEQDYGREIAIRIARMLVFYLSRPGFQAQFGSLLPVYHEEHIAHKTQTWVSRRLHEKLDVNDVADALNMSTRNFTRVFTRQTGMPPAKFIEKLRVESARKYLEDTDIPLERIAEQCGLGGLVSMRRVFLRHLMATPSDYRHAFRTSLKNLGSDSLLLPTP